MSRPYTQKRRAEQTAETRQRIVDAAVALHGSVGPARTTMSMIAERAGVQRHTLYAHFPDEKSVLMACSGAVFEADPPPSAEAWRAIADPAERLRAGLGAVHAWHARSPELNACVLRDMEVHPPVREIMELRLGPTLAGWHEVLGEPLTPPRRAMLALMLSFYSWRTLAQEAGLAPEAVVDLAVKAILAA